MYFFSFRTSKLVGFMRLIEDRKGLWSFLFQQPFIPTTNREMTHVRTPSITWVQVWPSFGFPLPADQWPVPASFLTIHVYSSFWDDATQANIYQVGIQFRGGQRKKYKRIETPLRRGVHGSSIISLSFVQE